VLLLLSCACVCLNTFALYIYIRFSFFLPYIVVQLLWKERRRWRAAIKEEEHAIIAPSHIVMMMVVRWTRQEKKFRQIHFFPSNLECTAEWPKVKDENTLKACYVTLFRVSSSSCQSFNTRQHVKIFHSHEVKIFHSRL